ncbi:MAG: ferrochelatase [Fibrobacterales bacterium]
MKKQGLLLIQLGSPASGSETDVHAYLKSFLSDPRLVKQSLFWKILLRAVILPKRVPKVAKKYRSILVEEQLPLHYYTEQFTEGVARILSDAYEVRHAYVHGMQPLVKTALQELKECGVDALMAVPLYPQFAEAMTTSAEDALLKGLKSLRWKPRVNFVSSFYDSSYYIQSLGEVHTRLLSREPVEKLLLSFHGYPMSKINVGDPYYTHCLATAELLKKELSLGSEDIIPCFQSKFGPGEWLSPATDDIIRSLREQGVRRIAISSPSFVADNLETLEEIGMEYRDLFLELGGDSCLVIPSLNSEPDWIKGFATLVKEKVFELTKE